MGKSTVAGQVVRLLTARGSDAESINLIGYYRLDGTPATRGEIRVDRVRGFLHRPRLTLATVACYAREGSGKALSWMLNLCRRNRVAGNLAQRSGIVVLEEGPLSALCLAAAWRTSPWSIDEVIPSIHLPARVVLLAADPETVHARLIQRAGILSKEPREKVMALMERYRKASADLEARLTVPVLRYDTTREDAPSLAARIISDLRLDLDGEGVHE